MPANGMAMDRALDSRARYGRDDKDKLGHGSDPKNKRGAPAAEAKGGRKPAQSKEEQGVERYKATLRKNWGAGWEERLGPEEFDRRARAGYKSEQFHRKVNALLKQGGHKPYKRGETYNAPDSHATPEEAVKKILEVREFGKEYKKNRQAEKDKEASEKAQRKQQRQEKAQQKEKEKQERQARGPYKPTPEHRQKMTAGAQATRERLQMQHSRSDMRRNASGQARPPAKGFRGDLSRAVAALPPREQMAYHKAILDYDNATGSYEHAVEASRYTGRYETVNTKRKVMQNAQAALEKMEADIRKTIPPRKKGGGKAKDDKYGGLTPQESARRRAELDQYHRDVRARQLENAQASRGRPPQTGKPKKKGARDAARDGNVPVKATKIETVQRGSGGGAGMPRGAGSRSAVVKILAVGKPEHEKYVGMTGRLTGRTSSGWTVLVDTPSAKDALPGSLNPQKHPTGSYGFAKQQLADMRKRTHSADQAMDESLRSIDDDGHMVVAESRISKANVCPYYGREIPDYERLGLDPEKTYKLFRHPDELAKGACTFTGKPLIKSHKAITDETPHQSLWVGTVGACTFEPPYLITRPLTIITEEGKELVEKDKQSQLSAGYRYEADMTPGIYAGEHYDGVMRNIRGNHVALVEEGRAGPDVHVADELPPSLKQLETMKNRTLIALLQARGFVADEVDILALDAALGEVPAKSVVTLSKDEMKEAEDDALAEKRESEGEDAALDEEEREAAWEKARDRKRRGHDAEREEDAEDAEPEEAEDDERDEAEDEEREDGEDEEREDGEDEEKEDGEDGMEEMDPKKFSGDRRGGRDSRRGARDAEVDHRNDFNGEKDFPKANKSGKAGDSRRGHDSRPRGISRGVSQEALDASIKAAEKRAREQAIKDVTKRTRQLAMACDEVAPLVGKVQMHAFDDAGQVYAFALERVGYELKGMNKASYRDVVQSELRHAKRRPQTETRSSGSAHAHDASKGSDYVDAFDVFGVSTH